MNAPQKKPIHARFNDAFEDLQRYDAAAKDQNINPALIQKRCTEFEKEWTEKLDEARLNHCIQPMKDAVDAVRSEKTPDTSFANEDNMRPPLKITQEATRRLAQGMTRQEFERDI